MPWLRRSAADADDRRSAVELWRAAAGRETITAASLLGVVVAAQRELPSSTAYALLAAAYLAAAELAGLGSVPTDEACRLTGLAAAALKRGTAIGAMPDAVTQRFQIIRGRLRGSVFVPRDVEEAFAGHTERLEPLATDPAALKVTKKLFVESRRRPEDLEDLRQFMRAVAEATAS